MKNSRNNKTPSQMGAEQNFYIPKTPMRFIWHTSKPHLFLAIPTVIFIFIGQSNATFVPYIIAQLVDGTLVAATVEDQLRHIYIWGSIFVWVTFFLYLSWRLSGFVGLLWLTRQNATANNTLFKYISQHSHAYFSNRFAGSLSNKISNAADGGSRLLERTLWGAVPQSITVIGIAVLLAFAHIYLALVYTFLAVLVIVFNLYAIRKRRPHVVRYSLSSSVLRGESVDFLTNIQAVRQYVRSEDELSRLSMRVDERRKKDSYQWRFGEWISVTNNLFAVLLTAFAMFGSYKLLQAQIISVGDVVLVVVSMFRVGHAFVSIGDIMNAIIRLYGEAEEGLSEILNDHEIVDNKNAKTLRVKNADVEFVGVDFAYENQEVFKKLNLMIHAGERIGLVGPSGAGKTTFVSLLLRQHEIDGGEIRIDGQDISQVTQASLRKSITVVPQEPLLFHRSIQENIAYGKMSATKKEIEKAARMAKAHDFISVLPQGYKTLVGERGVKLSGGQKQRVAIARAMLKDAPILVLDEATSALDSQSEIAIQKALHTLMEGKTVLAIAHRLSTLREMDRILVLDKGKIVEDGSHEELVKKKGLYASLWEHQAGGFIQE